MKLQFCSQHDALQPSTFRVGAGASRNEISRATCVMLAPGSSVQTVKPHVDRIFVEWIWTGDDKHPPRKHYFDSNRRHLENNGVSYGDGRKGHLSRGGFPVMTRLRSCGSDRSDSRRRER